MQYVYLLRSICEAIDKKCRNILWGDSENNMKVHFVSWDKVCTLKYFDGLGLRMVRDINNTSLVMAVWDLCLNPEAFWVRVINNKYKRGLTSIPKVYVIKLGSNFWRELCVH